MNMKEIVDAATLRAIRYNADAATEHVYAALREGRLEATWCEACERWFWPPRLHCPEDLGHEVVWRPTPTEGTLLAFTWQERGFRFLKPELLGLVELAPGLVLFTHVKGRYEERRIGERVRFEPIEIAPGLVLHAFGPVTDQ